METLPGEKGLQIYGWCIMPSHVHMIIGSNKNKLEDILRDMKSHTSTVMKNLIKGNPQESRKDACLPVGRDVMVNGKSRKEKWQQ